MRARAWTLLAVVAAVAVAWIAVPVWLLQPFAPQSQAAVEWSWQLRRLAPAVTAVAALISLALAARLWPRPAMHSTPTAMTASRRATVVPLMVARGALVFLVAAVAGTAWFARQNHFEWMFRPFPDARFLVAGEATDVPAAEPVIGVADGTAALAFPITRLGYHHLVNTTLGDVPIVATY
ncbi:MAG: hypothetical protein ABI880_06625 [Acidobacteriota bacterium]